MHVTDIDAKKASRDQRNPDCLHCVVMQAIEAHFAATCTIDAALVASKLAECTVEIICSIPDRAKRRRAMRFAHDALDANLKSQRTGKMVAVDVPVEH